jgi:hypothetical protein
MASPRTLGALTPAFALTRWRRRRVDKGDLQEVRRELGVGADNPDQHLVIFRATAIGFKSPYQCQGVFKA